MHTSSKDSWLHTRPPVKHTRDRHQLGYIPHASDGVCSRGASSKGWSREQTFAIVLLSDTRPTTGSNGLRIDYLRRKHPTSYFLFDTRFDQSRPTREQNMFAERHIHNPVAYTSTIRSFVHDATTADLRFNKLCSAAEVLTI